MTSVITAIVNLAALLGGLIGAAQESSRTYNGNPTPFVLLAVAGAVNVCLSHFGQQSCCWLSLFIQRKKSEERLRIRNLEREIDGKIDVDLPVVRRDSPPSV